MPVYIIDMLIFFGKEDYFVRTAGYIIHSGANGLNSSAPEWIR